MLEQLTHTWVISYFVTFTSLLLQPIFQRFQPIRSMASQTNGTQWFRLPTDVRPVHYDLTMLSDLERLTFHGVADIALAVEQDTQRIEFNIGKGLEVSQVLVSFDGHHHVVQPSVDKQHERVTLSLPQSVAQGSSLSIVAGYKGEIDQSMMGYYQSTWRHDGESGHYALTQFEPTSARRAFPCWDEPSHKATYTFRMLHRTNTTALANMPSVRSQHVDVAQVAKLLHIDDLHLDMSALGDDSWTLTEFAKTPKMSTYLVAWANGVFRYIEGAYTSPITGQQVPMRVYTTPEYIHQAQYALEVKQKVLPEYEKVFDIAYPLPKLDTLVASDFDAGAMENWGLITGRTSVFLYDEKSGLQGLKLTAAVQSHECAHMWFGDIATMAWWDNLWLNEAFATLMGEVIILDRVFPEWKSASEFIVSHLNRALDLDGKRSSHPIEVPLQGENVEDAVNQVFDAISYSKGASVLRMLAQMLGEDVFLRGVSQYLKRHLYSNTVTKDLWDGISEASGLDVNAIMANWVLKQGFPVLTVTEGTDSIHVRQNRFLSTGDPAPEEDETLWQVPLALKTVQDGKATTDMNAMLPGVRETDIPVPDAKNSVWKLNAETIGVYRGAYSPEHLAKLGKAAAQKDSAFSLEDRVGLVSDAFTLAQAGYSKTSGGLALMHALRGDNSSLVNTAAALNLGKLASVWWEQPQSVRDGINRFRADVFGPMARELTFEFGANDSSELRELRETVITAAASAGDTWTLDEIRRRFAPLQEHGDYSLIHPDLLRTVLSQAVKHGGEAEYETVMGVYRAPPTPAHKTSAMVALGTTQDAALIQRTIEFVFSGQVKTQDFMYFFMSLSSNPRSRRTLWETVKTRFDDLVKTFEGNFSLANLIKSSISTFTSDADARDIQQFFSSRDTSKFSMSLAQGLDTVHAQTRWLERDAQDVARWLETQGYM